MDPERSLHPDETVDAEAAAHLLEVPVDRIAVLVDDGVLAPLPDRSDRAFRVADVMAVRHLGG